jgi:hypothetical protein
MAKMTMYACRAPRQRLKRLVGRVKQRERDGAPVTHEMPETFVQALRQSATRAPALRRADAQAIRISGPCAAIALASVFSGANSVTR